MSGPPQCECDVARDSAPCAACAWLHGGSVTEAEVIHALRQCNGAAPLEALRLETGLSDRTLRRVLKVLHDRERIVVERDRDEDNRNTAIYRLARVGGDRRPGRGGDRGAKLRGGG